MSIKKLIKQAKLCEMQKNTSKAISLYKEVLTIDPDNSYVHFNLGTMYHESGDLIEAEKCYKQALKSQPDFIEAEFNLGLLFKKQGQKEEAVQSFESIYKKAKSNSLKEEVKQELKELSNNNYEKCDKCGEISILDKAFRNTYRGWLCPGCHAKPSLILWFIKLGIFIYGMFIIFSIFSTSTIQYNPVIIIINSVLFFLWYIILIFLHEFVHALAFYLLGGKIFEISIGQGPLIFQVKFKSKFILSFRKVPDGGLCFAAFLPDKDKRLQKAIAYGAGLLLHLLLIILSIPFFNAGSPYYTISFWKILFIINIIKFVSNLPRWVSIGTHKIPTDGLRIIKLAKQGTTEEEKKAYYILECLYLLKWKSFSELLEKSEQALSKWKNDFQFTIFKTIALPYFGKYDEIIRLLEELLNSIKQSGEKDIEKDTLITEFQKSILYNNLAYYILCSTDNSLQMKEALKYSKYAYIRMPWVPSILGTMGFALIRNKYITRGITLLKQAIKLSEEDSQKATNHAHLAYTYFQENMCKQARENLKIANALDPDEIMVKKITSEIGKKLY